MRDEVEVPDQVSASVVNLPAAWNTAQDHEETLASLKATLLAKLMQSVGKDPTQATERDWFMAAALTARDRVVHRWLASERESHGQGRKRVYYLSLEFLIGRLLFDVLENLGLYDLFHDAFGDLGIDLARLRTAEPDAALGNGGLGRLAACFMESMATLGIPAYGYGIRYDHGLFRQVITDGVQQEYPEDWLSFGNPWEFARPEVIYDVQFGGWVETLEDKRGNQRAIWHSAETIEAIAYDVPIVGWRGKRVNPLRLWSARAVDPMRLDAFNRGDHAEALGEQVRAEAISKILYPSDESDAGQELRLRQEYFFVSASLQDLVARHIESYGDIHSLPERASIQLNDTHPSLAVPELMRILVDLHRMPWHEAWAITVATLSYTNHTLLPEALESWPVPLFTRVLPRHLQIIYLINEQHLKSAQQRRPDDLGFLASVSVIDEHNGRRVRMGHLAFLGSHRVNGVSGLHTELMRKTVFRDLHALHPERIVNKTNGIDFRRWLHQSNPRLTDLLRSACGDSVLDDATALERLLPQLDDTALQEKFTSIKRANKLALSRVIRERFDLRVDPAALFDVQVKRIHEYKRQLLNLLETIALYNAIRAQPHREWTPRVKIFAGKAAASYVQAKLIIRLAHDVAKIVNRDPLVRNLLKIVFLPNYNVSLAEAIMPAADLSEQISTAGMEASGTGNMKLALNGAITIGTLDGANVEIRNNVGENNIFIFGLQADEVAQRWTQGWDPRTAIATSPELSQVLDAIEQGVFSPDEPHRYRPLVDSLRYGDHYMIAADFDGYYDTQRAVDALWRSPKAWAKMAMINTAKMAWFSSDRSIAEYATEIWRVPFDPVRQP